MFSTPEEKLEIYYYLLRSLSFMVETDPEPINEKIRPQLEAILDFAAKYM